MHRIASSIVTIDLRNCLERVWHFFVQSKYSVFFIIISSKEFVIAKKTCYCITSYNRKVVGKEMRLTHSEGRDRLSLLTFREECNV